MSMATMQMAQRAEQCCSYCDASPARNGSIYTWPEALGLHHCEACCNWEIANAHPGYFVALAKDNESASGNIGAVDAWLNTMMAQGITQGQRERRAWERAMAKGNGKGKGKAGSRSRSPRRFQGVEQ